MNSILIRVATTALLAHAATAATAGALEKAETTQALFAGETRDPYTLAVRAYVWGLPLVEAAQIRLKRLSSGIPINTIRHERTLADPTRRIGVGPNNDTLYSNAWLDLADGPLILRTPDFGQRYYSFQIAGADSSSDLSFGQRTHGGVLPPIFIVGPDYHGRPPNNMLLARSPTRFALLAGRTLVRGADDLAAVHALQDQISLTRPRGTPVRASAVSRPLANGSNDTPAELLFLERLGDVLRDWGPVKPDPGLIRSFGRIGLDTRAGFQLAHLTAKDRAALIVGIVDGRRIVERKSRKLGVTANGWTMNLKGPRFGSDYLLRAGVAKDQIFVTVPEEAIYPIARVDANGRALDGANDYVIRMSPDQIPPVNAFWSITMYDDQGFMVENPIKRYSIGDRTRDLFRQSDGSIEILLQHGAPAAGQVNWLPTPVGAFYLMMRLYNPKREVVTGQWTPAPIRQLP